MNATIAFGATGGTAEIDIVDVFAATPGRGNPVAIVYGCDTTPKDWKQNFAHWIGQPETVFVKLASDMDDVHQVEIFSPVCELPFAGHPAIGAMRSLLDRGLVAPGATEIPLRCLAGLVPMRVGDDGGAISFLTPRSALVAAMEATAKRSVAECLRGPAALRDVVIADTGARWIVAVVDTVDDLYRFDPDMSRIAQLSSEEGVSGISVVAEAATEEGVRFVELRSFGPVIGVPEDAVCGGGNACVAAALSAHLGFAPSSADYIARQGRALGREGRVEVCGPTIDRRFRIGGRACRIVSGNVRVPV